MVAIMNRDLADHFCRALTDKCRAALAEKIVRLPTTEEWDYACKAGATTLYFSGDSENDLLRAAWTSSNSGNKLHQGGQKMPNAFWLYDMLGNAREWTSDGWPRGGAFNSPGLYSDGFGSHSTGFRVTISSPLDPK